MTIGQAVVFWLIAAIVFIVLEGVTAQLVSLWFVIGTIPALIAAALGANGIVQGVLFLATSILVLLLFRPMLQERLATEQKATNADRVIGMTGLVLEEVNNLQGTGRVSANGLDWTARTEQDETILAKDSRVTVLRIEGVTLLVAPAKHGHPGQEEE